MHVLKCKLMYVCMYVFIYIYKYIYSSFFEDFFKGILLFRVRSHTIHYTYFCNWYTDHCQLYLRNMALTHDVVFVVLESFVAFSIGSVWRRSIFNPLYFYNISFNLQIIVWCISSEAKLLTLSYWHSPSLTHFSYMQNNKAVTTNLNSSSSHCIFLDPV